MSATLRKCYFVIYKTGGLPSHNKLKEAIMKNAKLMAIVALAFAVTTTFAANIVKSKRGDIDLYSDKNGGSVICTASFNDELTIIKNDINSVFVKGTCGRGWIDKGKVEIIAKGPGDKSIIMDDVGIEAWIDNPSAIFVLEENADDFDGVEINRDFKEYLTFTMDREQTEMRNGEN